MIEHSIELKDCCRHLLENEQGSCLFGCNSVVDTDTGLCPSCQDHSANRIECERCGTSFENWNGKWEEAR